MITQELQHAGTASPSLTHQQLVGTFDLCIRKTRGNIRRLADEPKSAAWAADGND